MRTFRRCIVIDCPWQVVDLCLVFPSMRDHEMRALVGSFTFRVGAR